MRKFNSAITALLAFLVLFVSSSAFAGGGPAYSNEQLTYELLKLKELQAKDHAQLSLHRSRINALEAENAELIDAVVWLQTTSKIKGEQVNAIEVQVESNTIWIDQNGSKVAQLWAWLPILQGMNSQMSVISENLNWALQKLEMLDGVWNDMIAAVVWVKSVSPYINKEYGGPEGDSLIRIKSDVLSVNSDTYLGGGLKVSGPFDGPYYDLGVWLNCLVQNGQTGGDCQLE